MSTLDLTDIGVDLDEDATWKAIGRALKAGEHGSKITALRLTRKQIARLRQAVVNKSKFGETKGVLTLDTPFGRVTLEAAK